MRCRWRMQDVGDVPVRRDTRSASRFARPSARPKARQARAGAPRFCFWARRIRPGVVRHSVLLRLHDSVRNHPVKSLQLFKPQHPTAVPCAPVRVVCTRRTGTRRTPGKQSHSSSAVMTPIWDSNGSEEDGRVPVSFPSEGDIQVQLHTPTKRNKTKSVPGRNPAYTSFAFGNVQAGPRVVTCHAYDRRAFETERQWLFCCV